MLVPSALDRALARVEAEKAQREGREPLSLPQSTALLTELTDPLRDLVQSQVLARRWEQLRPSGRDLADVSRETMSDFAKRWGDIRSRLEIVPGDTVLSQFRRVIQERFGISLTDRRIVEAMRREDIAEDLVALLESLDAFRQAAP